MVTNEDKMKLWNTKEWLKREVGNNRMLEKLCRDKLRGVSQREMANKYGYDETLVSKAFSAIRYLSRNKEIDIEVEINDKDKGKD